jgi:hypothetical protein
VGNLKQKQQQQQQKHQQLKTSKTKIIAIMSYLKQPGGCVHLSWFYKRSESVDAGSKILGLPSFQFTYLLTYITIPYSLLDFKMILFSDAWIQ